MAITTGRRRMSLLSCAPALRCLALGISALLGLAACGQAGDAGSKTGGPAEPVVLTLADGYSNPAYEPAVAYFMQRLEELSGGQVKVKDEQGWGDLAPGFEGQIVSDVASGKADLGWTGTRVFDTLGVTSFRALTAPMLIDSYPLEDAVIGSALPAQMLKGLDTVGVSGLAVLGDGLRKPIAKDKPLVSPGDWKGVSFNVVRSKTAAAAVAATGAVPTDDLSGQWEAGERNLRIYRENYSQDYPYVTANVNLWPQTLALFANQDRLARLTTAQRSWVQQAAKDAASRSTAFFDHDQEMVTTSCDKGTRFAEASAADLASLRSMFDGVYTDLRRDAATGSYLDRITAMKQALPAPAPLAVPAACNADRTPATDADPLAGVWVTRNLTEADVVHAFVAAGGKESDGHEFFAQLGGGATRTAAIRLSFRHGSLDQFERGDSGRFVHGDARSYVTQGATVTFSTPGCDAKYTAAVKDDSLRLRAIAECPGHDQPYGVTIYGSFPFTKAG